MERPARWLSFTRMPSPSEPRWLAPPPARTAAFSSARRPGVVLRVSRMRDRPWASATNRRVRVAMPERWPTRLRAVRSAVSTDASGPSISAMTWPGRTSTPSLDSEAHRPRRRRPPRRPRWRTAGRPARRPGRATRTADDLGPVGHQAGGQVAEDAEVLGQGPGHDLPNRGQRADRASSRRSPRGGTGGSTRAR